MRTHLASKIFGLYVLGNADAGRDSILGSVNDKWWRLSVSIPKRNTYLMGMQYIGATVQSLDSYTLALRFLNNLSKFYQPSDRFTPTGRTSEGLLLLPTCKPSSLKLGKLNPTFLLPPFVFCSSFLHNTDTYCCFSCQEVKIRNTSKSSIWILQLWTVCF